MRTSCVEFCTKLGWPMYNPQVIIPEYSVEERRVDYALCHPPSKPLVFIEVKPVGQIEGAERQLFEYAFHRGVPIAILTDGREWHFFHPGGEGDYRERLVYQLNLIETDSKESEERLNRYLNYDRIRTSEAIRAIEDDYWIVVEQRQIEASLSEAWIKLVEEADELLLDIVAEITESLCGHRPTGEQVLDFLKSLEKVEPQVPSPSIQEEPPSKRRKRGPNTRLVVTIPNGEKIDHNNASDTLVDVIERIGMEKVKEVFPNLVSDSEFPRNNRRVGEYNVNTGANTKGMKRQLERIAERFGIQLKVDIVPKVSN